MEQYRALAQTIEENSDLVSAFQKRCPYLEQEPDQPVSEPDACGLILGLSKGKGRWQSPCLPWALWGIQLIFGVSLEVSFIERKKDEQSLQKQHKVLHPSHLSASLFAQKNGR